MTRPEGTHRPVTVVVAVVVVREDLDRTLRRHPIGADGADRGLDLGLDRSRHRHPIGADGAEVADVAGAAETAGVEATGEEVAEGGEAVRAA